MTRDTINSSDKSSFSPNEKAQAFSLYMKMGQDKIRKEKTSLSVSQIKSRLVKTWQVMTPDEKNDCMENAKGVILHSR